jgi:alanine racemase
VVHLSNSAATLRWRTFDHDMVRIGIGLYGLSPSPDMVLPEGLAPALRLQSRLARVTTLAPGESVSYGRTYVAQRGEIIGLVPIGYADGYRRGLSNRGVMTLNGVEALVRGRVCMDQTVINLPEATHPHVGDVIDVISIVPGDPNSVASIARQLGTINYEVVTGLSRRLPRIYIKGQQVVALQDLQAVSPLDQS